MSSFLSSARGLWWWWWWWWWWWPRLGAGAPLLWCLIFFPLLCQAQAPERLVVIKMDGLPYAEVDRFVCEIDPRTGKSRLPWIDYIFYQKGTRLSNFYVRGMSLSAPSWSLLDTGQHLQIKGNVEYDRWTLHAYDYLNFIPFYLNNVVQRRVDMPGPEALDGLGIPLLMDAFPYERRHTSFQLFQRGIRWTTLQRGLGNRFTSRTPGELFDEWVMGFDARRIISEQLERELAEKLSDPNIKYLDYYDTDFDHTAHHNGDRESHLRSLQHLDAIIGRIWAHIQRSPLAAETVLVLVSDHGINSVEGIYSQGFNMVQLLGSDGGGGHHVVTKRRLMLDYSIKGIYPLVPLITTTTRESKYLRGESASYPTALVDFDGNERIAIHLRESDFNVLHLLLQQLQRQDLPESLRGPAVTGFFSVIDKRRQSWNQAIGELDEEMQALRQEIEALENSCPPNPRSGLNRMRIPDATRKRFD
ncbi:MAG: alkaline phosphatase family protein [Pyrinomonadaceae bacterium]